MTVLPRCEEVVGFAEKLIIALAPLRELLSQECFEMKGLREAELVREIARRLMRARFGEPAVDVAGEHGMPRLRATHTHHLTSLESEGGVNGNARRLL